MIIEMSNALVQSAKQVLDPSVEPILGQLCRRDNLPATPGGVDLADAADLARVVVLLGGEVLPHEEVGGARVDGIAQVLKGVEDDGVGEGLRVGGGEPALLVGEDEAHDIAAGADAGDADFAAVEGGYRGDFGALCAG